VQGKPPYTTKAHLRRGIAVIGKGEPENRNPFGAYCTTLFMQTPKLVYDFIRSRVYIATRYTEDAIGRIKVLEKHDVTEDFDGIAVRRGFWEETEVGQQTREKFAAAEK